MYELIDNDATDTIGIKLTEGEFTGTSFRFLNVSASENDDEDEGLISYSFEIIEGDQALRENKEFHKHMGEILHELIISALDKHLGKDS